MIAIHGTCSPLSSSFLWSFIFLGPLLLCSLCIAGTVILIECELFSYSLRFYIQQSSDTTPANQAPTTPCYHWQSACLSIIGIHFLPIPHTTLVCVICDWRNKDDKTTEYLMPLVFFIVGFFYNCYNRLLYFFSCFSPQCFAPRLLS